MREGTIEVPSRESSRMLMNKENDMNTDKRAAKWSLKARKAALAAALVAICCALAVGGSLAYFTAEGTARNVITTGDVEVTVIEQQLVDGALRPYPDQPIQFMPSTAISKIVTVRSEEQPAWIRMGYEIVIYDAEGKRKDVSDAELAELIIIGHTSTKWMFEDGWWYYPDALKDGETTEPLFDSVSFSGPGMGNEYQNCTMEIIVTAQAVQQVHNGSTVMEACWPE